MVLIATKQQLIYSVRIKQPRLSGTIPSLTADAGLQARIILLIIIKYI